jgi:hypothetical protein
VEWFQPGSSLDGFWFQPGSSLVPAWFQPGSSLKTREIVFLTFSGFFFALLKAPFNFLFERNLKEQFCKLAAVTAGLRPDIFF